MDRARNRTLSRGGDAAAITTWNISFPPPRWQDVEDVLAAVAPEARHPGSRVCGTSHDVHDRYHGKRNKDSYGGQN
jgi:hypothetical protein